jgi:hypothetical protein
VRFVAWARLWSPLTAREERGEAWKVLGLPDSFEARGALFWKTFQMSDAAAGVPLLIHAALGREGTPVREDWLRVIEHLGLQWQGASLPSDHLGVDCDVYACAIARGEPVLVEELCRRYLIPWCDQARARLEPGSPLSPVIDALRSDLEAARSTSSEVSRTRHPAVA